MGDPVGMEAAHELAVGMCGIRSTGDMVLRVQLAKGYKIDRAKAYVAEKLGVPVEDLADPLMMAELREKHGLGMMQPTDNVPINMEVKMRIAEILDLPINSVERFKKRAGLN